MITRLFVGTADGLFAIDSNNQDRRLPGRAVANLIPAADGGWLAILDRRVVVRGSSSGPDAVEWQEVVGIENAETASIARHGETIWIGTFPPHVLRWDGRELLRSEAFDHVPGKERWFTPWGGPPETRSLAVTPDGTIFANVHVGGIPRSIDGGASWQPTIEVRADVHQVIIHPDDPALILAAAARGLGISRDGGDSWEIHNEGVHGHYMSAVATAGSHAFVTSSTGSSNNACSAIYRFDLTNPGPFEKVHDGLPEWFTGNINTFCLATGNGSIAFGTRDGEVFTANLDDLAWQQVASDLPPVQTIQIEPGS